MQKTRPIETYYNGYRFRSRLEARWAVFFDSAFIDYQYEPEGYVLSDGNCYLPDFYLPLFHMFVEIKPSDATDDVVYEARSKLEKLYKSDLFAEEGKGITVALFQGDPMDSVDLIYCKGKCKNKYKNEWHPMAFKKGVFGEHNGVKYRFKRHETIISVYGEENEIYGTSAYDCNSRLINDNEIVGCLSTFRNAKLKARQARFEFGERG